MSHGRSAEIDGRPTLAFEDPEGQRLSLVADGGQVEACAWGKSPVPAEHQIRGLGPITLSVADLARTALCSPMSWLPQVRDHAADLAHRVHVFKIGAGGPAAELHAPSGRI